MKTARWSSFARPFLAASIGLAAMAITTPVTHAQVPGTGAVEGRVLDPGRGGYLERARITIEGTAQETFTDSDGHYRLGDVPAGRATLRVFFTGLVPQIKTVIVAAGETTQLDIMIADTGTRAASPEGATQLSEYVVTASREMDGAAIAINEQRFAPNIISVVAADEFGHVVDGTPGEVLKFLPGVTVGYGAGEARTVSINGAPAESTPITVAGFDLASDGSNAFNNRVTNLDRVSINNMARLEVQHSPTPESPGSALAGSVNMVPRSAFEKSRSSTNYTAFITMRDSEWDFDRTPGPFHGPHRKVLPGFNFSTIVPVNRRFGFTLSGNHVEQFFPNNVIQLEWRGVGYPSNGNTLPDTTPDRPYLTSVIVNDDLRLTQNTSMGVTFDYKLTPTDRISFQVQHAYNAVRHAARQITFLANQVRPGDFGLDYTHGVPGQGEVRLDNNNVRHWFGNTFTSSLIYRHDGPVWKAEAGAGVSRSGLHIRDIERGSLANARARRTGVTVAFDDISYLGPGRISVTDAAGAPVDYSRLDSYALTLASTRENDSFSNRRSARANLQRGFDIRGAPLALKIGVDARQQLRDQRILDNEATYTPVGPDGVFATSPLAAAGADQVASLWFDADASKRGAPYGLPTIQRIDNFKLWDYLQAHPEHFVRNAGDQNSDYRDIVGNAKFASEVISAAFLRGDLAMFNRRLQFVGGVRAEQTNIKAQGPLSDPTLNYRRDAGGNVIDGNSAQAGVQPILIVPSSDALGISKLTYLERRQHTKKEYLRLFPNLNASFNLRENLIARASYYWSVGRPNFNQYAGGLTLPDTESVPATNNRITVNNAGIKAWSARTLKVRFEYYFERVGQLSIGAFRREYENFFGNTLFAPPPEFLAYYGLDPEIYGRYDVSTSYNLPGVVRSSGVEIDYKQALTFLPDWARGVQVFANASAQRFTGADTVTTNFDGFLPRTYNAGISLSRPRYALKAAWNYRGKYRAGPVAAGRGIEPGTFNYGSKRLYVDVSAEFNLGRHFGLFANVRNLDEATEDAKIYGPSTPASANFRSRNDYGAAWTFGVKGSF